MLLLGLLPLESRTQADEAGCVVISAGAETDTLTGSVQNVGQVVIGGAFSRSISLHAGAVHCLSMHAHPAACPCGDFDGDNSVTLVDFITFQVCFGASKPTEDCPSDAFACADLNGDGNVNLNDFVTFQTLFGLSPDGLAPPDCLKVD